MHDWKAEFALGQILAEALVLFVLEVQETRLSANDAQEQTGHDGRPTLTASDCRFR